MAKIGTFRVKFLQHLANKPFQSGNLHLNTRSIVSVADGGVEKKSRPFGNYDYLSKGWPYHRFIDRTHRIINENSKVISIEGNLGVGKEKLATKLAEKFDMKVLSDTTDDDLWLINGFREPLNVLEFNDMLPESAKYYSRQIFWNDPDPVGKGRPLYLQYRIYLDKCFKYCKMMCELFNTGNGFFTNRGPHSDYIMAKTMLECGLMSQRAYDWYYYARRNTAPGLWKPHIIIYLRTPVDMVRQNINKRNIDWEVNAKNLTDKFLHTYQKNLENEYLTRMRDYSEIVEVDLQEIDIDNENDIDYLVDRLSQIDLDGTKLDDLDKKFQQWTDGTHNSDALDYSRACWSSMNRSFFSKFGILEKPLDLREGRYDYDDHFMQTELLNRDPRSKHARGDDPDKDSVFDRWMYGPKRTSNYAMDTPKLFMWA